ncbi:MurR/RpiR family transcriptional regulator [Mitsuokella sp.]|uniref:MurR/RpiR family transcriptional regulator n=1 Tax=Mitsuokella TaxID=52225 RepID=UPI0029E3565B|nr:MurR/RpiR family transcriptional regulator [Mitsuokella sp.]MDD6381856.1 MurR/RpiR family transcriptional regulator [Selenomonadaceae bacterium]MDY4475426.1 MurR/RpiR family transcriptional regulator [Mitsuokella sp.]
MDRLSRFPLFRSAYKTMTRTEKRIVDYIITHDKEIMTETIAELASHTKSSEISVSRFCKKLGFSGLQSLKIALASDMAQSEGVVFPALIAEDTTQTIATRIFKNISDGLQDTLKLLDFQAIDQSADLLLKARQILVFGFGNSATVCQDIETRFLRFGLSIHAYEDAHMQFTTAALAKQNDVVIAVSHRGTTRELLDSVKIAKKNGASLIAITSYIHSPLAELADIVLSGMGREVRFCSEAISSRLIHMAISDVLYMRLAMRIPDLYEKNMQKMREAIIKKRVP